MPLKRKPILDAVFLGIPRTRDQIAQKSRIKPNATDYKKGKKKTTNKTADNNILLYSLINALEYTSLNEKNTSPPNPFPWSSMNTVEEEAKGA